MPKKRKKGRKFRLILVLILLLLILIWVLGAYVFNINIKNIYIKGNNMLSDQEIIELGNVEDYPNFFKTSSIKIEKSIEKSPFIKSCKVTKKLLCQIKIDVEEYKTLFIRIDTNKIVLENKKEIDYKKEILDIPYLINYVPDEKYHTLIDKMSKIDYNVISKISEIKYYPNKYDEDRFLLYMDDKNHVYVTLTKFSLLNKYNTFVTKLEAKTGTLYLDSGNYFEINK